MKTETIKTLKDTANTIANALSAFSKVLSDRVAELNKAEIARKELLADIRRNIREDRDEMHCLSEIAEEVIFAVDEMSDTTDDCVDECYTLIDEGETVEGCLDDMWKKGYLDEVLPEDERYDYSADIVKDTDDTEDTEVVENNTEEEA